MTLVALRTRNSVNIPLPGPISKINALFPKGNASTYGSGFLIFALLFNPNDIK